MDILFLTAGILGLLAGILSQAFATGILYWMIDEVNERSPADRQTGLFSPSRWKVQQRHRELYPDSPKRRQAAVASVIGPLMFFAGISLIFDWNSLNELNKDRAVAPRQQAVTVPLAPGEPAGHNTYRYRYTFSIGEILYDGSEYSAPESPTRIGQRITVYYDPLDPRVNSPRRFEYSSQDRMRRAGDYLFWDSYDLVSSNCGACLDRNRKARIVAQQHPAPVALERVNKFWI